MPAPGSQPAAAATVVAPECVQGARTARTIIARTSAAGRQAGSATTRAQLRRSIDRLSAAARSAQRELAGCAVAPSPIAPMDHATMKMPAGRGSRPPAATAPMDHATMKMPGGRGSRPPAAGAPMDHATMKMPAGASPPAAVDHSKMNMGAPSGPPSTGATKPDPRMPVMPAERVMDPACPDADTATAPKAAFDRKVYYFCSERERDEFRKDPAAYLKKRPRG